MLLQEFEGVITGISKSEVIAEITDMTNTDNPNEIVTFCRDAFPNKIILGNYFKWLINDDSASQVSEISIIDLGKWTKDEIESAEIEAKELVKYFNTL